jgi:hypothetical protein
MCLRNFDLLVKGERHNLEIYSAGLYIEGIKFENLIYTSVGEACGSYLKLEKHLSIRLKGEEDHRKLTFRPLQAPL